jgi:hypothetical protein
MSDLKLYEIATEYKNIVDLIIDAGGEITPEQEEQLNGLQQAIDIKATNIAHIVLQADDEIDILQKHIDRLEQLKLARINAIKGIKKYLINAMQYTGVKEIKLETMKISIRESKAIEIVDENTLPQEAFVIVPEKRSASKTAIKELLKNGVEVNGAKEVTNYNLQIK